MSTNIRKVLSTQSDGTIGHCETIAIHSQSNNMGFQKQIQNRPFKKQMNLNLLSNAVQHLKKVCPFNREKSQIQGFVPAYF